MFCKSITLLLYYTFLKNNVKRQFKFTSPKRVRNHSEETKENGQYVFSWKKP